MELDLDGILDYPDEIFEGDIGPQPSQNNQFVEHEQPQRNGEDENKPKRYCGYHRSIHIPDPSALDKSIDWYLTTDFNEKKTISVDPGDSDITIRRIQSARSTQVSDENFTILRYPPRNSTNWLPVTTPIERERVYLTLKPETAIARPKNLKSYFGDRKLLHSNFDDLLAEAGRINEFKRQNKDTECPVGTSDFFTPEFFTEDSLGIIAGTGDLNAALWVDKYKPRIFTDLLSDDGVNRTLLTWLKLWDQCVFGRVPRKQPSFKKPVISISSNTGNFNRPQQFFSGKNVNRNGKTGFAAGVDEIPTALDYHKRPQHKIALLCGSPGVGKTTLAHVIARHAGYHVQEMNASDDRTLEAFRKQLEGAITMKSTLDGDKRPHCLVIDEIDGAPAPSVNYLVSLVGGAAAAAGDDAKDVTKKRSPGHILRRPIICICNDLYAPSLRQLRKIALVLQTPEVDEARLAERLHQVAVSERIMVETGAIEILCRKADNDVRSCINTIQFLSLAPSPAVDTDSRQERNHRRVGLNDVSKIDVGRKDTQKSIFAVLRDVFIIPKTKKRMYHNSSMVPTRAQHVLEVASQCNEEDRLYAGLFENYLLPSFRDPRLQSICRGLDWLSIIDQFDRFTNETQTYGLKRYHIYLPVCFHLLFATGAFVKLQYPQSLHEGLSKTTDTLHSLINDMKGGVRAFLNSTTLVLDTLPTLLHILQPSLRAVNPELYAPDEKDQLRRIIETMGQFNLTYRQQRTIHGQYEFVLEPPVDHVVNFRPDNKLSAGLPYGAKQFIAREVDLAKVRGKEIAVTQELIKAAAKKQNDVAKASKLAAAKPNLATHPFLIYYANAKKKTAPDSNNTANSFDWLRPTK